MYTKHFLTETNRILDAVDLPIKVYARMYRNYRYSPLMLKINQPRMEPLFLFRLCTFNLSRVVARILICRPIMLMYYAYDHSGRPTGYYFKDVQVELLTSLKTRSFRGRIDRADNYIRHLTRG